MDDKFRFRRQFLLTRRKESFLDWQYVDIDDFRLLYHSDLTLTTTISASKMLYMLGELYDWQEPDLTNQQILDRLSRTDGLSSFWAELSHYAGQYVMVYRDAGHFLLFNDAAGQSEIYYDDNFSHFASQPKLVGEMVELKPRRDSDAVSFFASAQFLNQGLPIAETTFAENIKHLIPNHYLDLVKRKAVRYFPTQPIVPKPIAEVVPQAAKMLKGYIKAVSLRKKTAMAVTGGWDSRVLFLASLDIDCQYFVLQLQRIPTNHYDIWVPQRLTKQYGRLFEVIPEKDECEDLSGSIDFPRKFPKQSKYFEGRVYLNGNISEIARNNYGYINPVKADELAYLKGYGGFQVATAAYRQWLADEPCFHANGYDTLDMFYWEEGMGGRVAKEKTIMGALGYEVFSPFNSRDLLILLLSTPRKSRDYYVNRLYRALLLELSPDALKVPINPGLKRRIFRMLTRCGIYRIYRHIGLKYRFLKI